MSCRVPEAQAAGVVGVVFDAPAVVVDEVVVPVADQGHVAGVGGAAFGPRRDVVDLDPADLAAGGDAPTSMGRVPDATTVRTWGSAATARTGSIPK